MASGKNSTILEKGPMQDAPRGPLPSYIRDPYVQLTAEGLDTYRVKMHSNKLCLILLAPEHPFLQRRWDSVAITMNEGVLETFSGRRKKGAKSILKGTRLFSVEATDADGATETFELVTPIDGRVFELNPNLVDRPELLTGQPDTRGYLAILEPTKKQLGRLLAADQ